MVSRAPSFQFACTLDVLVPASHVYLACARLMRSGFPVSERMADVAVPCARDRRPSPRACDRSKPQHAWLRRAWSYKVGLDDRLGPRTTFERWLCELLSLLVVRWYSEVALTLVAACV
eukprot:6201974-Pleurochrysis_carterae.AAC.1